MKRFWAKETNIGRVTPPGFIPNSPLVQTQASSSREIPNPFIPIHNPATGRWRPARYSRRRQAELVKAARLLQVETILPLGPKGQRKLGGIPPAPLAEPHALLRKALKEHVTWNGEPPALNEKGLYGSRRFMFKGHKWERQRPEREQNLHDFKVKYDEKRYVYPFQGITLCIQLYSFAVLLPNHVNSNLSVALIANDERVDCYNEAWSCLLLSNMIHLQCDALIYLWELFGFSSSSFPSSMISNPTHHIKDPGPLPLSARSQQTNHKGRPSQYRIRSKFAIGKLTERPVSNDNRPWQKSHSTY